MAARLLQYVRYLQPQGNAAWQTIAMMTARWSGLLLHDSPVELLPARQIQMLHLEAKWIP